jgi:OmpA-OmpF porin, OOP family
MSKLPEQSRPKREGQCQPVHRLRLVAWSLTLIGGVTPGLLAQPSVDVKGSRDHPMISRIEGSTIKGFAQKEFDEYRLVKDIVPGYTADGVIRKDPEQALNDANSIRLEGRVWRLTYQVPQDRSTLEIMRSYQTGLTKAGFKVLFQCTNRECGGPPVKVNPGRYYLPHVQAGALNQLLMKRGGFTVSGRVSDDQRYVAAHLARAEGDVYVSVLALGTTHPIARVDVIEVKPMTPDGVKVAAVMAADLSTHGSVALYGIYFDTDRADVKPESRAALSEIATLLKQDARLALIVVGHTDNIGTLDHNLELSLNRAQAVVAALTSGFAIDRTRLEARGVGFLAPVAPNTNEDGRARNRRVQLLQQ